MFHFGWIQQDLVFLDFSTQYGGLCHAAGSEKARADCPIGNRAQILQGGGVGCQGYEHQLTENRRLRPQCGIAYIWREGIFHNSYLLGNYLTGTVDVRSPIELHPDNGKAGGRRGTYTTYIRRSVYCCFYRERYKPFHFFGSHTFGFGHHDHRRCIQVRENIHVHICGGIYSRQHQQYRRNKNNKPVVE